jgi:hypothetical protein
MEFGIGVKGGPQLRYSAKQRRSETKQKRNLLEYNKSIKKFIPGSNDTTYEMVLTGKKKNSESDSTIVGLKSCYYSKFYNYLKERGKYRQLLESLFQQSRYRRMNYRAQLGRKQSEHKLINRIEKIFDSEKTGKKIIIFWGNWGRNPNLKNQPPTPGIGLRNNVSRIYKTFTVDERYTSSICPHCDSEVLHPKLENMDTEKHHLLRCKNENCSRWWQRDVMAVANFKRQVEYGLQNGCNNPVFTRLDKPLKRKRSRKITTN